MKITATPEQILIFNKAMNKLTGEEIDAVATWGADLYRSGMRKSAMTMMIGGLIGLCAAVCVDKVIDIKKKKEQEQ